MVLSDIPSNLEDSFNIFPRSKLSADLHWLVFDMLSLGEFSQALTIRAYQMHLVIPFLLEIRELIANERLSRT
jgi:hypothetical protein